MRLTISRESTDQLPYESTLVRAVPQRELGILDPEQRRSTAILTLCSCCKRALLEPDGWLELVDASIRLKLFEEEHVPELRHTVCPECADALKSIAEDDNAA
jgi:hypothetical protein